MIGRGENGDKRHRVSVTIARVFKTCVKINFAHKYYTREPVNWGN